MKTIRALVARMNDDAASGFAKGSIRWTADVPVTDTFDLGKLPIGTARLMVDEDGVRVFAEMSIRDGFDPVGKYPALGGTGHTTRMDTEGGNRVLTSFSARQVALSDTPNADPQIPAIAAPAEADV